MLLDKAKNYHEYEAAISYFTCPGQNFVFASKSGDIALWQQGAFPAKWPGQGDFIMPGTDTAYNWQATIPHADNPHLVNPARGFVSSANQLPADSAYPYFLSGSYDLYRGKIINRYLSQMTGATVADMQRMQADNYNLFAATALPFLLKHVDASSLQAGEKKYLDLVARWNQRNDNDEQGATVFTAWYDNLSNLVWNDELAQQPQPSVKPEDYTLIEALLKDTAFSFVDNVNTPFKETITQLVTDALRQAVPAFETAEKDGTFSWSRHKDAGIRHLLRLAPLSRFHLNTGGGENVINATKQFHGPSWRMIVQLTDSTQAVGVYPGGQSGNPGSRYYDNFVDDWAAGRYHPLWVMKIEEATNTKVHHTISFVP